MSFLGRNNGIAYFVLVGVAIGRHLEPFAWLPLILVQLFAWLLLLSTLLSILDRAWALFELKR